MSEKMYKKETEMYYDVIPWFKQILSHENKGKVYVYDTSRTSLWKFLRKKDYDKLFPDYITYDIHVDITGIVINENEASLNFIECKLEGISLKDISQLLGYSRVAIPKISLIISPKPISSSVSYLLRTYNRYDVLEYSKGRKIKIALWNKNRKEVDVRSILPPGEHL